MSPRYFANPAAITTTQMIPTADVENQHRLLSGSAGPSGRVAPADEAFSKGAGSRFGVGEATGYHLGGEAGG
jgi:hypothetical protein